MPVFYSVAQHCTIMSYMLEDTHGRDHARAALLHEAGECYWHDDPTPVKPFQPSRSALERRATLHFFRECNVPVSLLDDPGLMHADQVMFVTEVRDLFPEEAQKIFHLTADPDEEIIIQAVGPNTAYRAFLKRARELFGDRPEFQLY